MKRIFTALITAALFFGTTNVAQAQQPSSPFNLNSLLNLDFNELFNQLEEEMESTEGIWSQFFNMNQMDSSMVQLKELSQSGIFDSIFNQLQLQMNDMGDISNMINQFMNQMDLGNIQNLLSPSNTTPSSPQDLNNGEWQVVPDIPKEDPKPKVNPKKVSDI